MKNKFAVIALLFYLNGCAGQELNKETAVRTPAEYVASQDTNETWRALMRFASQNGYRFLKLESDQGIMEISSGDIYDTDYSSYYLHYNLDVVGLAQGTRIVVDTAFFDNAGQEVTPRGSMEKIKADKNRQMLLKIKNFFENGKGR